MEHLIDYITRVIHTTLLTFLENRKGTLPASPNLPLPDNLLNNRQLTQEELIIFMLALLPHISPHVLDIFLLRNKELDIPYTNIGGWKGVSHIGFLPTGETAAFLIAQKDPDKLKEVIALFGKEHWFFKERVLWLEEQGEGEPYLSGRLRASDEILANVYGLSYQLEYNNTFPAKKITTTLEWTDLVVPFELEEELEEINFWLQYGKKIRQQYSLDRLIKPGYRCLFHGPPGTGKTLTAQLLGKQNQLDVYRVDLSMIVSKYIGETEKNLAGIFDKAEHHNWILFFDEADALFGQRTGTQSSNDRYANQEVSYLLQRIEDHPGTIVLATNLKENIDEAFLRRFQNILYFPMPDEHLRRQLWQKNDSL